ILLGVSYFSLFFVPLLHLPLFQYGTLIIVAITFGVSASIIIMIINVTFMQRTDQEYLGRVAGILNSLAMVSIPLGSLIVAGLCVFLSVTQLFLVFGIVMVVSFMLQKYNKSIEDI
ncbi:MAG: hypothetical protein RR192_01705, partial [Peptostreptococcaceae bacterium]